MGQTHSNTNNGEAERTMVEQDAMVLNEEPAMKKQVTLSLAETSVGDESDEGEDSDDEYDAEFEEARAERRRILEEAKELKKLARMYLHPEDPIVTNPSACARCYFDRASAVEQESYEEAEERANVLADAANLKRLAVHYMHPEIGVKTTDSTAYARNYFDRASAVEQESYEEAEERANVLADAANLKRLAVHYMHPEIGVKSTDSTVYGRNYFSRFSADEVDSVEESEERAKALADCEALLKRIDVVSKNSTSAKTVLPLPSKVIPAPQVKTVDTSITKSVSRSASHVKLFGLDEESGDNSF
jgi:adenosyl cobinamide kinase/adenosyl cobinamide phosphate guanylyltransferase